MTTQSYFKTELKHWALWYTQLTGQRTQVDIMHGTIAQACRYLHKDYTKKEKYCDPSPWFFPTVAIMKSPSEHADEWMEWFISTSIEEWNQRYRTNTAQFLDTWAHAQQVVKKNVGVW